MCMCAMATANVVLGTSISKAISFRLNLGVVPSIGQDGISPAFSRRGGRLVYVRYQRDLDIWRAQIPGGTPAPFISSSRNEEGPRFSPDGRRIAFRSDRSGSDEIWVCDSDASNAVQLTNFGGPVIADLN